MSPVALSRFTLVLSGTFSLLLFTLGFTLSSDMALAQASDSLVDFGGAFVLAFVVQMAQKPSDRGHPFGHTRAEPLGALAIAALATLLAFQVGYAAVESLLQGTQVRPTAYLFAAFLGKVAFKSFVFWQARGRTGAALEALAVDAKNDILVGFIAVVGFFGARWGWKSADAWLSFPIALYIGWAGFRLGQENVERLMGQAPSDERQAELLQIARSIPGIDDVHDLRAHYLGSELSIHVHVSMPAELTLREAHDRGERVRLALEAEEDVLHCSVHIDPG